MQAGAKRSRGRWIALAVMALIGAPFAGAAPEDYFTIEVLDAATGRGVPLVEMETVNHLKFVTDSQGLIAINEPDLLNTKVYFTIRAPGYEVLKDEQGFSGQSTMVRPGLTARMKLKRLNLAERLYRLTGSGIYRDSLLLGRDVPIEEPLLNGNVSGQDSMMAVLFRNHLFWFGGDTLQMKYPLGQYWTSGAISEAPSETSLDPDRGVNLHYLVDEEGFARPMWPRPAEGTIWTDGVVVLTEESGLQRMVAHYSHMRTLTEMIAHGIGVFDEQKVQFVMTGEMPKDTGWRYLNGHPVTGRGPDAGMLLMGAPDADVAPFLVVRVKADFETLKKPESYTAFTYLKPGSGLPQRDAAGRLVYDWKPGANPVGFRHERALVECGFITEAEALYQVRDVETGKLVEFHAGSVEWNDYRHKWILIASQAGSGNSFSGEMWYAEAELPIGPWHTARRIATHGPQSFYNPLQHAFFDQEDGRYVYFEGTYANTSGGPAGQTPRYDYNQLMYRLDLSDQRLWSLDSARVRAPLLPPLRIPFSPEPFRPPEPLVPLEP